MNAEDRALLETIEPIAPDLGSLVRGRTRLATAMDRPRSTMGWGLAAAATLVVVMGLVSRPHAVDRLRQGDLRILDAEDRGVEFSIGDRARVRVDGPGRVDVRRLTPGGAVSLALESPSSQHVVASGPRLPYVIEMGVWTVSVMGTRFSLRADRGALELDLTEGSVRVEGPGVDATYRAPTHERFELPGREPVVPAPLPLPPDHGAEGTEATKDRSPSASTSRANRRRRPRASASRRPDSVAEEAKGRPSWAPRPERGNPSLLPAVDPSPEPEPPREAPAPGPDGRAEVSSSMRLQEIEALVRARAFSEARVRLEAYLDVAEASPRTDLAGLRIAVGLEDEVALTKLSESLSRRAHDPRLEVEVIYWQGELARRRHDCTRAEPRFEHVIERDGARAEDALWSLGWCLTQSGSFDRATKVLNSYLSRYPRGRYAARARAWLKKDRP